MSFHSWCRHLLERVLFHLTEHINAGNPTFSSGIKLFDFFYPVWRAVIFVAGAALIVISQEIKKGNEWTYPLAIITVCAAVHWRLLHVPALYQFCSRLSPANGHLIDWIDRLLGFIFLRKAEKVVKWTRFAALTFIGMLSTHAFTIGIGAQRTMWTRPGYPFYKDFTWWLFNWAGEANWVAVILLFLSIPLLAVGKRKGWWLAVTGAIAILMINVPTQFFRTKTLDYLYGSLLAIGVLFFTMVPFFKKHLLEDETEEA